MSSLKVVSSVLGILSAIALSAILIKGSQNLFQNSPEVGLDIKTNPAFTQNYSEYSNHGFKLKYPKNWSLEKYQPNEFSQIVAELIPPTRNSQSSIAPKVLIEVRPLNKTTSLTTVNQEATQAISNFLPNANIFENREVSLSNHPAYLLMYTGLEGQNKLRRMQVGIVKEEYLYLIIYEAKIEQYQNYETTVKQIVNSFELL
jgi:PsbP-like protein